jgi:hypothetical protein
MNYLNCTQSPQSNSAALFDSGCTAHFLIANAHCKHKLFAQSPLEVRLPNGAVTASTHTTTLDLPPFPKAAMQAHILPGVAQHLLLSVGQMCDSGCAVTITAKEVAVAQGTAKKLTGTRDKDAGIWCVTLGNTNPEQSSHLHAANNVYEQRSIQDTIAYLHACCFSPVKDTWLKY